MDIIEKKISNFIQSQFPAHYRDNGPVLVAFVTEYYKWLESQDQTLYHTRRILEYKDIDTTVDQFIIYFKTKYLSEIQFNTETNIKQIVKHSLDLYRSKGTERGVDLLFRLIFGVGADVYYPASDLMKLSDGKWKVPKYLEVALNENNIRFSNKQIRGLTTDSTAFVESVVRRIVAGRLIDVLYISAINGNFQTEEIIIVEDDDILKNERIKVIGSLTRIEVDVNGTGFGYELGDSVDLYSDKGRQAKGRVTSTTNINGLVNFNLVNGGYGFNGNAEVIVSEKVLALSNVQINANNITNSYFKLFETLTQPIANIAYSNYDPGFAPSPSANGIYPSFSLGTNLYTYHPNNSIKGSGIVLAATSTNSSAGQIRVSIVSGNLNDTSIYSTANAIFANQVSYTNRTATANIIGISDVYTIQFTGSNGNFAIGEEVYQLNSNNDAEVANGIVSTFVKSIGSNGFVKISNTVGLFKNDLYIRSRATNSVINSVSLGFNVGVFDISNNFISNTYNYVYSSNSLSNATISVISQGTGASFEISNDVIYTETLYDISLDYIRDYANVQLNVLTYLFPGNTAANLSYGAIGDALTIENINIGKISSLVQVNRGEDYNLPPFVAVYQPEIYTYKKKDSVVNITGATTGFTVGELVEQVSTNARGLIKQGSNSSVLFMERLRFYDANNFTITTGTSSQISGVESGFVANVTSVFEDANTKYLGLNSIVLSDTIVGNGSITSMQISDSGFGFVNGETISFENENGISTGIAVVSTQGKSQGFYQQKGGFLSDQKKLHDGNYYQEYSYEVRSSVMLNKYSDMLKKILHVSGTKFFGALIYKSIANTPLDITSFTVTKSIANQLITENGNYLILETGTGNVIETES